MTSGRIKDRIGIRYGRLVVSSYAGNHPKDHKAMWNCVCDCGNSVVIKGTNLTRGTASCGCIVKEMMKEKQTKHGESKSKLYMIAGSIMQRCTNKNHPAYKNYGGRGIECPDTVDEMFEILKQVPGYKEGLEIDRIDNNKGYRNISNLRWVTVKENARNRRTYRDETYYESNPTRKSWFKKFCKSRGLRYEDYEPTLVEKHKINSNSKFIFKKNVLDTYMIGGKR